MSHNQPPKQAKDLIKSPECPNSGWLEEGAWWAFVTPVCFALCVLIVIVSAISGAPVPLPKRTQEPVQEQELCGNWSYLWAPSIGQPLESCLLVLNRGGSCQDMWGGGQVWTGTWEFSGHDTVKVVEKNGHSQVSWSFTVYRNGRRLEGNVYGLRKR